MTNKQHANRQQTNKQTNKQTNNNTTTNKQLKSDRPFSSSLKAQVKELKEKLIQVSGRTTLVLGSQRARS